jgi:CDP-glucose 4,6-dehydratase
MQPKTTSKNFWKSKRILLTGFNGFKGSWMTLMLNQLGAKVYGYSLNSKKEKKMNKIFNLEKNCEDFIYGNLLNKPKLLKFYKKVRPHIIIHMASQSIVLDGYANPLNTFLTNNIGLCNLLLLDKTNVKFKKTPIFVLTSDKCYENNESNKHFKESDSLSGDDPYSASKACQEIICNSLRKSYGLNISTARAGNVIGGGDFTENRIITDIINSIYLNKKLLIRNVNSTRPWQHVLDININYLKFIKAFYKNSKLAQSWNFGPKNSLSVGKILNFFKQKKNLKYVIKKSKVKEKKKLNLSTNKIYKKLKIKNNYSINKSLNLTLDWYEIFYSKRGDVYPYTIKQIKKIIHETKINK